MTQRTSIAFSLGGVAAEIFRYAADWTERVFAGELSEPGRDARYYVQRCGDITDGSADPAWWLSQVPLDIAAVRNLSR